MANSFQDVANKHQIKIAWSTLKMNGIGASLLGIGYTSAMQVLREAGVSEGKLKSKLAEFGHSPEEIEQIMCKPW